MPTITPLPDPPSRADPSTFADKGDAWNGALPTFSSELQGVADAVMAATALPGSSATSTTSLTIGTGSKALTVETGRAYVPGVDVSIAYAADATQRMIGTVTAYDTGTGALAVNVSSYSGSGTYADWDVGMALAVSFDGRTYTDLRLAGKITEEVYVLSGTDIDPANGTIQTKILSGNTTFTASLASGQSLVLLLTAGAYAVTWPSMVWLKGVAPTLATTGVSAVVLFKVDAVLYGVFGGSTLS